MLTIPPNSEILTNGVLENHQNISTCFGLVEPVVDLGNEEDVEENTVIVARTLVNLNTEGIPIRLINLSSKPIEIQRGQTLGEIVPIKGVIEFGMEEKYTNASFSEYHRICRIHQSNLHDQGLVPKMTSRGQIRLQTVPAEFYSEAVNLNRIEMDQPLQQNAMEETIITSIATLIRRIFIIV